MSCSCTHTHPHTAGSPCGFVGVPDVANEPLSSALDNFTAEFFGTVTKTLIDGAVSWELPCDLATGLPGNPRAEGEGLACYFIRLIEEGSTTLDGGALLLPEIAVSPAADPTKGQVFVKNGALYYLSPGGTETQLAPA